MPNLELWSLFLFLSCLLCHCHQMKQVLHILLCFKQTSKHIKISSIAKHLSSKISVENESHSAPLNEFMGRLFFAPVHLNKWPNAIWFLWTPLQETDFFLCVFGYAKIFYIETPLPNRRTHEGNISATTQIISAESDADACIRCRGKVSSELYWI